MAGIRTQSQAPDGFRYVTATHEENAEWRAKHKRHTSQYRLACTACGKRIWGSGLGIGAHRRACPGRALPVQIPTPTPTTEETTTVTTIKPAPLFEDANAAGGWTDSPTVARRLCTAIWKATNAFGRITNYQADVVLDYETILRNVQNLEPGAQFEFTYSVGDNGTHLATLLSTQADGIGEREHYDGWVESVLNYDSGPNTAKFIGWVTRSEYQTDTYGNRYGADKYGLVIHTVELVK